MWRHLGSLRPLALAVAALLLAGTAMAQDKPVRVRGEIENVTGQVITLATQSGETAKVTLAPEARILAVVPSSLEAIEPGTFIGTAAVPGPDGQLMALEVVVFPEAMRGTGEGHYAWDLTSESTMTNATVHEAEAEATGRVLHLRYPEGEKTVVVPPEAPIVTFEPGDASLLEPGSHVFIPGASREADGSLATKTVAVGKDGLVPPM
jgi:hypothetical protein